LITYDETLERLKRISVSRGEDYSYSYDPRALEVLKSYHPDYEPEYDVDGDEITTQCYYKFVDGSPGCIAGVFVSEIDPSYELREHENITVNLERPQEGNIRIAIEDSALHLLREAQRRQDLGEPWPKAVQEADKTVRSDVG